MKLENLSFCSISGPSTSSNIIKKPVNKPIYENLDDDDLWGEDCDDDLILVASQIERDYSQQQEAMHQSQYQMSHSYSTFAPQTGFVSTQKTSVTVISAQKSSNSNNQRIAEQEDMELLALVNNVENEVNKPGSSMKILQQIPAKHQNHHDFNSQKENTKDLQVKHLLT